MGGGESTAFLPFLPMAGRVEQKCKQSFDSCLGAAGEPFCGLATTGQLLAENMGHFYCIWASCVGVVVKLPDLVE